MRRPVIGVTIVGAVWASASFGQVAARTATPAEARAVEVGEYEAKAEQSMPSPMLLEFPLRSVSGVPAPAWMAMMKSPVWFTVDVGRFVCDKARVERVSFRHGKPKKDHVPITLSAAITSEWFRQDLDVTIALLGLDGQEVARQHWDDETFGNDSGLTFGGRSKTLKVDAKVPRSEWDRWMAKAGSPVVKILIDVQGEQDDD